MGVITENGWLQCARDDCETLLVPGTEDHEVRVELRAGDAATVLTAWAAWFHRNVRPINNEPFRNWWGWSATNDVWNSNLSGTAEDLCADQLPWKRYTMSQDQVDMVHRGLGLFEGTVFWGRDWGAGQQDEMHFQVGYNMVDNPRFAEFAQRLRDGYLNIFGPPDPLAFPLPPGYYYGPLDGPPQSVSGEYKADSQYAKDGLGRWQQALGLPATKKWNDGITPKAANTLQLAKGWPPNPAFGYGGVYLGEWNAVMREGWRLPQGWSPNQVAEPQIPLVKWGDYSQYQGAFVDGSYPYPIIAFRASIADQTDEKFLENMRRAKQLVASGKLKKIIAYHFWVPGRDNWGTFQSQLDASGGVFPELAYMVDVEDGGTKWNIRGDQTVGVKDFVKRGQDYFVNPQGASIYINFTANPDLLPNLPGDSDLRGVKLIVPRYAGPDEPPAVPAGVQVFGHQYASDEDTPPFGPTDINQSKITLTQWLSAWGTNGAVTRPVEQLAAKPEVRTPTRRQPRTQARTREVVAQTAGNGEGRDRPARRKPAPSGKKPAAGKKRLPAAGS
jgi:hypothetical protein